ncbi:hypothetical protein CYLTODRAFT_474965 [Cylindrobasidium torrendii FP15055 ss-10]|uniref:Uncharacterized protein n=1 Tax=Cylindrobasidium torrendii FP15055 ss-10 TaxID=1314674 RepID=A0A0D7AYD5_9AGAR|nr:hypothetical protein CYLTODRAFT_474965 [Cylindrobasidium torrendii FP15055 ss-10]
MVEEEDNDDVLMINGNDAHPQTITRTARYLHPDRRERPSFPSIPHNLPLHGGLTPAEARTVRQNQESASGLMGAARPSAGARASDTRPNNLDSMEIDPDLAWPRMMAFLRAIPLRSDHGRGLRFTALSRSGGQAVAVEDCAECFLNFLAVVNGGSPADFPFWTSIEPTAENFRVSIAGIYVSDHDFWMMNMTSGPGLAKGLMQASLDAALKTPFWVETDSEMGAKTLETKNSIGLGPRKRAQLQAQGTLLGVFFTRQQGFPPEISGCFILAAIAGAKAIMDFDFVLGVVPNLAQRIRPWPKLVESHGPLRNPSHPDRQAVVFLAETYLDLDEQALSLTSAPILERARSNIYRQVLLYSPPLESFSAYDSNGAVKAFKEAFNPVVNSRQKLRLFDVVKQPQLPGFIRQFCPGGRMTFLDLHKVLVFTPVAHASAALGTLQSEWQLCFWRWVSREGPLEHDSHQALNAVEEYQLEARKPGYRAQSFLQYVTGSKYIAPESPPIQASGPIDLNREAVQNSELHALYQDVIVSRSCFRTADVPLTAEVRKMVKRSRDYTEDNTEESIIPSMRYKTAKLLDNVIFKTNHLRAGEQTSIAQPSQSTLPVNSFTPPSPGPEPAPASSKLPILLFEPKAKR